MTTIGEFINKNINIFEKASSLEYLVFGVFPKDFLDKPINVSVSQKKGGLILSINNGKFVIIINNVFKNSGGGKSRKQKGKGKAKKSRKYQRGGNMSDTIAVIFLSIIMYVFIQNLGMKIPIKILQYFLPILITRSNFIKVFFHFSSKMIIQNCLKMSYQKVGYYYSNIRRHHFPFIGTHILL